AAGYAASLSLGVGQFCTNPGLVFAPDDEGLREAVVEAVAQTTGGPMLSERIKDGFLDGLRRLSRLERIAEGAPGDGPWAATPQVFTTHLTAFAADLPGSAEECFGPASIVVTYDDPAELPAVLERMPGSLTATVHSTDPSEAAAVVETLRRKAGRLIWNGWPTGVAVNWAMHHGGPWPASTAPAHTSVGARAIDRWLVPVAYQDWPEELPPPELRDTNPLGIPRRVDGTLRV